MIVVGMNSCSQDCKHLIFLKRLKNVKEMLVPLKPFESYLYGYNRLKKQCRQMVVKI